MSLPGYLIHLINTDTIYTQEIPGWSLKIIQKTWVYKNDALTALVDTLWESAQATESGVDLIQSTGIMIAYHIPTVKVCLICCYTCPCHWHIANRSGNQSLIAAQATAIIAAQTISKSDECKFHQCGKIIKLTKICSHIGSHILKARMQVHEDGLQEQVFLYFKSCHFQHCNLKNNLN